MSYQLRAVLFFLVLFPLAATAKKKRSYTTTDIITHTDSLLLKQVGDTVFRYCKLEAGSYYTYKKGSKVRFASFAEERTLPKGFETAYMRYTFQMPYPECPLYDTIKGLLSVEVQKDDTVFGFRLPPDISFIPQSAMSHEACTFISKEDAIKRAMLDNIKRGVNPPDAVLRYISSSKKFAWIVLSLMWDVQNHNGDKKAKRDIVMLDAETGEILKHETMLYEQEVNYIDSGNN